MDHKHRHAAPFGDHVFATPTQGAAEAPRCAPAATKRTRTQSLQEPPPQTDESEAQPRSRRDHQPLDPWSAESCIGPFGLTPEDDATSGSSSEPSSTEENGSPTNPRFDGHGMRVITRGMARSALSVGASPAGTNPVAATKASPAAALASPQSSPTSSTPPQPQASEDNVAARWRSGTALAKARKVPDAELVRELTEVRHALGRRTPDEQDDASYHALRTALTELEFEARRRTDIVSGQARSLDPMETTGPLSRTDEHSGRASGSETARTVAMRKLDYAIATRGLDGAEQEIKRIEAEVTERANAAEGSHATYDPMSWLRRELALRREEGEAFLDRFEQVGRSIALGMLGESAARLQSELTRYGLRHGQASSDGSLRGMGLSPGEKGAQISDAIAHGRALRAAYDRARAHPEAGRAAWDDFEHTKARAIAVHPILAGFLSGDTALGRAAPTGLVPDATELGAQSPELMAGLIGWELNQKLADNRATTEHIESGKLSIFGAPRVVELTKLEMRTADGMMLSGVVDEKVRNPPGAPWTEHLTSAITVALGLLLAGPPGAVSAGVALAGNLALLASDLYLIGRDAGERAIPNAATNTDVTVAQSLIDEEPSTAPLIQQLLGGLGLATGTLGVIQSAAHLHALSQARQGIAEMRTLRRTLVEHGADAMHAEVRAAAERLRATARNAGLPEDQIDAMIRTALRGGISPAASSASAGLDHAATLTDDTAAILAERLGVPRIVRTAEKGSRISVRLTQSGSLAVEQLEVAADATVADVLMHQVTLDALARYRGTLGKLRQVRDRLTELVRRESKPAASAVNPHAPRTRSHELFEEVRKHEAAVENRISALLGHLQDGGDASKRAAWALEDQLDVLEGELAHYRAALAESEATGNLSAARGVIESPGDASRAAQAKGYEAAPEGYYYRRNRYNPDEYEIARHAGRDDLPPLQVNRDGDRWSLGPADEARRQRIFSATLGDDEVLEAMLEGSPSWRLYQEALIDPSKVGLVPAEVQQRARRAIEKARTPHTRWSRGKAEVNEDLIRRALKEEFRADILQAALKPSGREEQVLFLRKLTEDFGFTNASDKGNLFEALLAAQEKSLVRHTVMDRARLAAMDPPVIISKDRVVDLFGPDGTLTEVKAVKTTMGKEQEEQLRDYLKVVERKVELPYRGKLVESKRIVYAFMEPEGVFANQAFIKKAMDGGATIRVYNKAGLAKEFNEGSSTIQDVMSFAVSTSR
jgi:hypothetical protein